jgi:hypothetical protein
VTVRKNRLKSGNASYCSSRILSYPLQSNNINIESYRTVILLVGLYRCDTWSLTLREENKMRDLNRNEWKIFGPKREKVTGDWRTLHKEKLHDLYSPNTVMMTRSRRMRLVGHVACTGTGEVRRGFWLGNLRE